MFTGEQVKREGHTFCSGGNCVKTARDPRNVGSFFIWDSKVKDGPQLSFALVVLKAFATRVAGNADNLGADNLAVAPKSDGTFDVSDTNEPNSPVLNFTHIELTDFAKGVNEGKLELLPS